MIRIRMLLSALLHNLLLIMDWTPHSSLFCFCWLTISSCSLSVVSNASEWLLEYYSTGQQARNMLTMNQRQQLFIRWFWQQKYRNLEYTPAEVMFTSPCVYFINETRSRISVLRIAPSPFRMRKLHISGSLIISIVRLLDDHISRMLVVIFIRMRVLFVTCNLHETVLYPDKIWHVLIKLLHTFAMTHTSYNTSFCK